MTAYGIKTAGEKGMSRGHPMGTSISLNGFFDLPFLNPPFASCTNLYLQYYTIASLLSLNFFTLIQSNRSSRHNIRHGRRGTFLMFTCFRLRHWCTYRIRWRLNFGCGEDYCGTQVIDLDKLSSSFLLFLMRGNCMGTRSWCTCGEGECQWLFERLVGLGSGVSPIAQSDPGMTLLSRHEAFCAVL